MKVLTVQELKEKFPRPKAADNADLRHDYCVGGAFIRTLGGKRGFPVASTIARYLRKANPDLSCDDAREFAKSIVSANDDSKFCVAWDHLERALLYYDPCKKLKRAKAKLEEL